MVLSGSQKVAILLLSIGKDIAADIIRQMNPSDVKQVMHAIQQMRQIDREIVDQVLLEIHDLLQIPQPIQGGPRSTKALLASAFGNSADSISEELGLNKTYGLPALDHINPEPLANFLRGEHPQTIALVCAHLTPQKFRDTLRLLPPDSYVDIFSRVAKLDVVDPETLEHLNSTLESLSDQQRHATKKLGGPEKIAALLNTLESEQSRALLEKLKADEPSLSEQIKQYMFTFDDLEKLDQQNMAVLLKHIDRKDLILALKLANPQVRNAIFASMSSRAAELLHEDFEAQGKVKKHEVETAQRKIAEIARRLLESGMIQILHPSEYVA